MAAFVASTLITPPDPICIVGAGPSGLTIANGLEDKGFSTIIFEKNPVVGGKCQEYYDPLFHPLGALLLSNVTYKETLPVVEASGVPLLPFANTAKTWLFDWITGEVQEAPLSPPELFLLVQEDTQRYTVFWNNIFSPKMTNIGYKNGIPEEYTVPFLQWLSANNLTSLQPIFEAGMVPYGYGDITETPAIYMLQYFTPDILHFFAGQHDGYLVDFHQVFVQYAENFVKGPILTNTNITKIDRSGDHPVITYTNQTGSTASQSCSKLILAFPPVMHALQAANLDISADETIVFSPVGITEYWSGAVSVAAPGGFRYEAETYEAVGQPSAFVRLFNESSVATTWSWGKYRGSRTMEEARILLKETLSKVNKDPRNATELPRPVTDDDVKEFQKWDYFAHYDPRELRAGFYGKFNALQGKQNTYYASGLNGFETVEFAIRAGKDVVDTYFPSS